MKFEACSKELYNFKGYTNTSNMRLLDDFMHSEHDCVRIVDHRWSSAKSGYGSILNSIRNYKYGGVKVFTRGGEIYLVKTHVK